MKKRDINYLRMATKLFDFFNLFLLLWQDNTAMSEIITDTRTICNKLEEDEEQQQIKIIGYALRKADQKKLVVDIADTIASGLRSYAEAINDTVLLGKVKFTRSEISAHRDVALQNLVIILNKTATSFLTTLPEYGITQDTINISETELKRFIAIKSEPALALAKRKLATAKINSTMPELKRIIKVRLDSFMKQYKITNPDFYNEYIINRQIIDTATHKLSLKGIVTDIKTESPLYKAIVTIPELKLETETTELGYYQFKSIKRGTYKVELQREGYKPITTKAEIIDNQTTELNIEMERN